MREKAPFILVVIAILFGFILLAGRGGDSANVATKTQTAKPSAKAATQSPMSRGSAEAKISLIQYSDFLCPSCAYFTTQVMPTIKQKYIDTGKINFEFRPMAFIAEGSSLAGQGAYCAIDQGKFWTYHDAVYTYTWNTAFSKGVDPKTTTILTTSTVESIAAAAGLDTAAFSDCLTSGEHADSIQNATNTANQQGVDSTPYILVNGKQLTGTPSVETTEALIESQL